VKNKYLPFLFCFILIIYGCARKGLPGSTSSGKSSSGNSSGLHILCYNIHHANPPSKPDFIDVAAIAKVIKQQAPDLVALQEVDVYTNRSGKTLHEAQEIARLSDMPYYYFAKAIDHDGGDYGVAILSKLPMSEMKNTPLPTADGTNGEHRTLATAVITVSNGKKIVFACTHLDAQRPDTNRLLQINKIVEVLNKEKLPLVIAADFNSTPSSRIINQLDKYFTRSCLVNCGFTIPVNNPRNTIDFVAYKPSAAFTVAEHKIVDEKYASDHLPVSVVLNVK